MLTAAINENTSHSTVSLEISECTGVFIEICNAPHYHKCPECQNLHECFFGRCQGKETGNCADCDPAQNTEEN